MTTFLSVLADSLPTYKKYLPQSFLDFKAKSVQRYLGLESHLYEEFCMFMTWLKKLHNTGESWKH